MSVTSTWTGPDPTALIPAVDAMIRAALLDTVRQFQAAADQAYAGTRFDGAFTFTPDVPVREATLFNTDDLFTVVEAPTRPHGIDARNAPYLVFQIGGRWVRTKHVNHPGTPGKLRMGPLLDRAFADLDARLSSGWEHLEV